MYRKIKKKFAGGITLIELLMAIVLFSLITGAAMLVLTVSLKTWNSNKDRINIRQNGNLALEEMVRYLELASNITAATTSAITFAADINNNGADETVTLAFDAVNKNLNVTVGGATTTITPYVQSFSFSYCASGTETPFTPPDPDTQGERDTIRVVILSLTMNKGSETISSSSSAYCRNQGVV